MTEYLSNLMIFKYEYVFKGRICWFRALAISVMENCAVKMSEHDAIQWDGVVVREGVDDVSTEELAVPAAGLGGHPYPRWAKTTNPNFQTKVFFND